MCGCIVQVKARPSHKKHITVTIINRLLCRQKSSSSFLCCKPRLVMFSYIRPWIGGMRGIPNAVSLCDTSHEKEEDASYEKEDDANQE